jgi:predicted nucleic acid-binding protein
LFIPPNKYKVVKSDPDDDRILEAAVEAQAEIID